jgi:hypothetical protein
MPETIFLSSVDREGREQDPPHKAGTHRRLSREAPDDRQRPSRLPCQPRAACEVVQLEGRIRSDAAMTSHRSGVALQHRKYLCPRGLVRRSHWALPWNTVTGSHPPGRHREGIYRNAPVGAHDIFNRFLYTCLGSAARRMKGVNFRDDTSPQTADRVFKALSDVCRKRAHPADKL